MIITLENISKKFNNNLLFSNINLEFKAGNKYVILGPNGSGKSTLLQIISGKVSPTSGKISYLSNSTIIPENKIYKNVAIAAPYIDLIEEFTFDEMIDFHFKFKKTYDKVSLSKLHAMINHPSVFGKKKIAHYSSGIKQRIKLLITILSNVKIILLDEPTTNLDAEGISWFQDLVKEYSKDRVFIICSNYKEEETSLCNCSVNISDYK
jgi:ABC-type multidrug transport system ATPase subunit